MPTELDPAWEYWDGGTIHDRHAVNIYLGDDMNTHDREQCGECQRDFLRVGMRQVTASGIHLCERCYQADPLRGDDGLWIEDADPDGDDESHEPVGSCEWCGCNLYPDDLGLEEELCDQCLRHAERNRGGEDGGIRPVS